MENAPGWQRLDMKDVDSLAGARHARVYGQVDPSTVRVPVRRIDLARIVHS